MRAQCWRWRQWRQFCSKWIRSWHSIVRDVAYTKPPKALKVGDKKWLRVWKEEKWKCTCNIVCCAKPRAEPYFVECFICIGAICIKFRFWPENCWHSKFVFGEYNCPTTVEFLSSSVALTDIRTDACKPCDLVHDATVAFLSKILV